MPAITTVAPNYNDRYNMRNLGNERYAMVGCRFPIMSICCSNWANKMPWRGW